MTARQIKVEDRVCFKTQVDGKIKDVEGIVLDFIPIKEARRRGLISKEGRRRSGTILEIEAYVDEHRKRLIYKHRSLVKQVK